MHDLSVQFDHISNIYIMSAIQNDQVFALLMGWFFVKTAQSTAFGPDISLTQGG